MEKIKRFQGSGIIYNRSKKAWYEGNNEVLTGTYNKGSNNYTVYNSDGTTSELSPEEYVNRQKKLVTDIRKSEERKYAIPFIKDKRIKLSEAGKASGAVLSTNLLDSIAKYANITGLPLEDALGLVFTESTFGGKGRGLGLMFDSLNKELKTNKTNRDEWSPILLTSNWNYYLNNPYTEYENSTKKITEDLVRKESERRKKKIDKWEIGRNNFNNKEKKFNIREHPLVNAFLYFLTGKYNTGNSNYNETVRRNGKTVMKSPEILQWKKNSKYVKK